MAATLDELIGVMQSIRVDLRDAFDRTTGELKKIAEKEKPRDDSRMDDSRDPFKRPESSPRSESFPWGPDRPVVPIPSLPPLHPTPLPKPPDPPSFDTPSDKLPTSHDSASSPAPDAKPGKGGGVSLGDIAYLLAAIRVSIMGGFDRVVEGLGGKKGEDDKKKSSDASGSPGKQFLSGIARGLKTLTAPLMVAQQAIVSFGQHIAAFVEKCNPTVVIRFNIALADFQAVIGRALAPVLERVTSLVRMMANAFTSLSATAQTFIGGLAVGIAFGAAVAGVVAAVDELVAVFGAIPVIIGAVAAAFAGITFTMESGKQISESFGAALRAIGTVIETVAGFVMPLVAGIVIPTLDALTTGLEAFVWALQGTIKVIEAIITLGGLLGNIVEDYDPNKKSSVGASVRQAQFSSAEAFANNAYKMAFQGTTDNIPYQQLEELKKIHTALSGKDPDAKTDYLGAAKRVGGATAGGAIIGGAASWWGLGVGAIPGAGIGFTLGVMREIFR